MKFTEDEFIAIAEKDGFWIAVRHFGITEKSEWDRLLTVMRSRP